MFCFIIICTSCNFEVLLWECSWTFQWLKSLFCVSAVVDAHALMLWVQHASFIVPVLSLSLSLSLSPISNVAKARNINDATKNSTFAVSDVVIPLFICFCSKNVLLCNQFSQTISQQMLKHLWTDASQLAQTALVKWITRQQPMALYICSVFCLFEAWEPNSSLTYICNNLTFPNLMWIDYKQNVILMTSSYLQLSVCWPHALGLCL